MTRTLAPFWLHLFMPFHYERMNTLSTECFCLRLELRNQ